MVASARKLNVTPNRGASVFPVDGGKTLVTTEAVLNEKFKRSNSLKDLCNVFNILGGAAGLTEVLESSVTGFQAKPLPPVTKVTFWEEGKFRQKTNPFFELFSVVQSY